MLPMVIASIEAQVKSIRDTLKDYLSMMPEVNRLREVEEKRQEARGDSDIPHRMQAK